jgi:hypothetical protein
MTLYNLATALEGRSETEDREAEQIYEQLLRSSPFYRSTWYLQRHLGAIAYHRAVERRAHGDHIGAITDFKRAAARYSKAIRARPRFRFFETEGLRRHIVRTYQQSPILLANARDAHEGANHQLRAFWFERRFQRLRHKFLETARRALERSEWMRAYAFADWAIVGRSDSTEAVARVLKAVGAQQVGWAEIAATEWDVAKELDPMVLMLRSELSERLHLVRGLPGDEPTEPAEVVALLEARGVISTHSQSPGD